MSTPEIDAQLKRLDDLLTKIRTPTHPKPKARPTKRTRLAVEDLSRYLNGECCDECESIESLRARCDLPDSRSA